mmetsp:Transcript_11867/g.39447  ORF Transcript_11867/g.39447 Transcript_11867/m.39447 type:complete len:582 (-) Transcript_11867:564-2309(-)
MAAEVVEPPNENVAEIRNSAFIPLGMNFIKELALELMPETEKDGLNDFMRMVRLLFHFEYLDERDKLKRNFDLVTAAQEQNDALVALTESQLSPQEFQDLSVDFVTDFCGLMADANFSLLTQNEWELAKAENFMFNLPIEIAWEKFDKELLGALLRQNPALSAGLTQFAESALLFKRGNGVAKASGMFITEKIDMLLEMLLMEPLLAFIGKPKPIIADINQGLPSRKPKGDPTKLGADGAMAQERHDVSVVERRTLRRLLPSAFSVLRNFFANHELQEPTFKEVVILYRMAKPTEGCKPGPGGAGALVLKSFRDIPMADMEMIFPEINIRVRFRDMLINVSLAVVALVTFAWTLLTGVEWTKEIITLITVLFGKVAQSAAALMAAQTRYAGAMARAIQSKSDNSQVGMLMHLMASMEDQECKEMILAFCVLSWNGKSMTLKEIDTKCETLLWKRFGLRVDFDVEGAVVKLLRDGLVEQRAGVLYTATPLPQALQRLDTKWDNLFTYTDDGGAAKGAELVMREGDARKTRFQTVEQSLSETLAKTDAERAAVVGKLKAQQDEIAEKIKTLEGAMGSYKWRTG